MQIPIELESLLTKRLELISEISNLHSRYGPGGTYVTRRDILFSELTKKYRADLLESDQKPTQGYVEELARTDPLYCSFIDEIEACRARLFVLYGQLKDLTMRINWITRTGGSEFEDYESELPEDMR